MAGDDEQPHSTKYAFDVAREVESDPEWWKARGKTAEKASTDLHDLAKNVQYFFKSNYFGDCIEGKEIHSLFRDVVAHWVADLEEQSASAQNLADACFAAAKTLSDADFDAASGIGPF
ncbi:MAG: hypothetical protein WAV90_05150 [Gordonia amarae]